MECAEVEPNISEVWRFPGHPSFMDVVVLSTITTSSTTTSTT